MKTIIRIITVSAFIGVYLFSISSLQAADKVLEFDLPKPKFSGTPVPIKGIPHLEKTAQGARPDFKVPSDVELVSEGKEVTSSDDWPIIGELEFLTDGDKDADEGYYVELGPELQWVQIDLEASKEIFAIVLWHYHSQARAYHDVVVQVSDDPEFGSGVKTIFNSDHDNSAGLGRGKDKAYIESYEGKLIDAKGVSGQYVRLYSQGNSTDTMNHYLEAQVFGR
ncbi:MAG: discoidin domain-containing protein [Verrucomicrobia bacterium]|nr:discoidin domain-containing protein [Verrucomicrobiota bacterium]